MSYLYGLSDFFSFVFEDTSTVNLLLEANAVSASEIYSNFLQLTSALSLSGIQTNIGVSIKLLLVKDSDKVGSTPKYKIAVPISKAKYLSNRPFLPTDLLESNVDFRITQIDPESCYIEFAKPLSEYKFSKRPTVSGENEYAIWVTDVKLDAQLMYKNYGKILGVAPEVSSDQFSNFIYGLYYLYVNGPTLQVMEQGLNLVLGIPLVRNPSTVIDIRYNSSTSQYIIITDIDQYLLPTGISPLVNIGDSLTIGDSLAKWIELKDYISDGAWWLNVSIPDNIIKNLSGNQTDRFAKAGSNFDYLMSNYLYKNTFLVRINIGLFNDNKYFSYLSDILYNAKPVYAQPVYVWKLDLGTTGEGVSLSEVSFTTNQIPTDVSTLRSINTFQINYSYND
jgi:hypothetical protein